MPLIYSSPPVPLYLGGFTLIAAIVITSKLEVVAEAKVDFDVEFATSYGITKGVLRNEAEGEVYAPVAMWLESLDLVLARLKEQGCAMHEIKGISGSCQQHGSVFWSTQGVSTLRKLDPHTNLKDQMAVAFAYQFAPNWQDFSTQEQCDEFDAYLGGPEKLAEVTGSSAHHRFTGTQIMRMRMRRPEVYSSTARISLVSSWLASILAGYIVPFDPSDVTGMNLWDIKAEKWYDPLLELCAGGGQTGASDLKNKLGDVRLDGGGSLGPISSYFVQRYGFSPDCQIVPFTGDNPATILALPLRPMDAIVSLGTSTTFLMSTNVYRPDPSYHFMNHPTTKDHFMFMLCYKNGGLAREKVRDALPKPTSGSPWTNFNKAVFETPPLDITRADDKAKLGLYFPLPEIVPNVKAGTWRYSCAPDGSGLEESHENWSAETDARIIVESQALSMRLRSHRLLKSPTNPTPGHLGRLYLVGGASLNPAIARVLGDVLGGIEGVYQLNVGGNACALGGAYKAVWAIERKEGERFDELIGKRWKAEGAIKKVDHGFKDGVFQAYGRIQGAFEEMEQRVLKVAKN